MRSSPRLRDNKRPMKNSQRGCVILGSTLLLYVDHIFNAKQTSAARRRYVIKTHCFAAWPLRACPPQKLATACTYVRRGTTKQILISDFRILYRTYRVHSVRKCKEGLCGCHHRVVVVSIVKCVFMFVHV